MDKFKAGDEVFVKCVVVYVTETDKETIYGFKVKNKRIEASAGFSDDILTLVNKTTEPKTLQQAAPHDAVANPSHYQGRFGLEAIEVHRNFMKEEQVVGYHLGNTLKYLLRYQNKNGLEDLKKAKVHLEWLISEYEKEGDSQ